LDKQLGKIAGTCLFEVRMFEKLIARLTGKPVSNRYAIQIGGQEAGQLNIPDATIIESWENGDGSVILIMESSQDLRPLAHVIPGVHGIQRV
jgi:hypothetical protein